MRIFEPDVINFDHLKFPLPDGVTETHIRRTLHDPGKRFLQEPIPGTIGTSYYIQGWAYPLAGTRAFPYQAYFGTISLVLLNVMFIDEGDQGKTAYIRFVQEADEEEYIAYVQAE